MINDRATTNITVVAEPAVRCPQTTRPASLSCSLAVKARCRSSFCPVVNPMQLAHADVAAAGSCSHAGLLILRGPGRNRLITCYMLGCGMMYRTNTLPRPWSGYPKGLSYAVYDTSYPP